MQYVSIKKLKVHSRDGGRSKNGRGAVITVAINELLCMKNAGAQIAMDFS